MPKLAYIPYQTCDFFQPSTILPLRFLACGKGPQDLHVLLQRCQPRLKRWLDLAWVVSKLSVEVLAVWGRAHCGAEDGLDHEGVVRLERVAVGVAEGVGELFAGVGGVVAESLRGEVEATSDTSVSDCMQNRKMNVVYGEAYRVNHRRPSVATCFFSLSSLMTRSWRVSERVGAASWRSRIF